MEITTLMMVVLVVSYVILVICTLINCFKTKTYGTLYIISDTDDGVQLYLDLEHIPDATKSKYVTFKLARK